MIEVLEDRIAKAEENIDCFQRDTYHMSIEFDRQQKEINDLWRIHIEFKEKANNHITVLYFGILAIAIGCIFLSTQIN